MIGTTIKPKIKDEIKVERPRLHKVILVNDDFTPREFVVIVLKAEFRMSEDQALRVMMTAHRRGACVVAVYTKDVAEAKATNATDAGRRKGYPYCSRPSRRNRPSIWWVRVHWVSGAGGEWNSPRLSPRGCSRITEHGGGFHPEERSFSFRPTWPSGRRRIARKNIVSVFAGCVAGEARRVQRLVARFSVREVGESPAAGCGIFFRILDR